MSNFLGELEWGVQGCILFRDASFKLDNPWSSGTYILIIHGFKFSLHLSILSNCVMHDVARTQDRVLRLMTIGFIENSGHECSQ